jgi:hypothetical protein
VRREVILASFSNSADIIEVGGPSWIYLRVTVEGTGSGHFPAADGNSLPDLLIKHVIVPVNNPILTVVRM